MNTFIKLMIAYFIEQQLGVAHEAASKAVEQLDMSYALNKFQHELGIAKSMKTGLSADTIKGSIAEIKLLCDQMEIDKSRTELFSDNLEGFVIEWLINEGITII